MHHALSIQRIPAEAVGEFSSPQSTLCADSYIMSVPLHVTAVARKKKNPGHSAKSAGGRLHLNMHTPLTLSLIHISEPTRPN